MQPERLTGTELITKYRRHSLSLSKSWMEEEVLTFYVLLRVRGDMLPGEHRDHPAT